MDEKLYASEDISVRGRVAISQVVEVLEFPLAIAAVINLALFRTPVSYLAILSFACAFGIYLYLRRQSRWKTDNWHPLRFRLRTMLVFFLMVCVSAPWWRELYGGHRGADDSKAAMPTSSKLGAERTIDFVPERRVVPMRPEAREMLERRSLKLRF